MQACQTQNTATGVLKPKSCLRTAVKKVIDLVFISEAFLPNFSVKYSRLYKYKHIMLDLLYKLAQVSLDSIRNRKDSCGPH